MKLRIKFSKYGNLIFVGHLDVMRYFQKAIRRAGIDIAYTTGFSPHQILSFAQPLGVGISSNAEYFDIRVNSLTSSKQVREALQAQMVEGIDILSVRLLADDAQNAMASIAAADYTVRFREGCEPQFDLFGQIEAFYAQKEIPVVKESKKTTKAFDLKPEIYELRADSEKKEIFMKLNASSAGNIKPSFVMEELYRFCGHTPGEFDFLITREEIYFQKKDTGHFIPLEDAGEEY